MSTIRYYNNNHKRSRWNLDTWERQSRCLYECSWLELTRVTVMDRDLRLTGVFRGQSDAVEAPTGFDGMFSAVSSYELLTLCSVNSRWKVSDAVGDDSSSLLMIYRPSPRSYEPVRTREALSRLSRTLAIHSIHKRKAFDRPNISAFENAFSSTLARALATWSRANWCG